MGNRKSQVIPVEPESDIPLVDCHCHFALKEKRRRMTESHEEQYKSFFEQHNGKFMITSGGWWDFRRMQNFMQSHKNIYLTMGWGPQTVTYGTEEELKEFPKYLSYLRAHPDEYVAIGEFGLDFHHGKNDQQRKLQIEYFRKTIRATKDLNKPYVLHVRNPSGNDVDPNAKEKSFNEPDICNRIITEIIDEEEIPPHQVMWHCFSGPKEWGPRLAKVGYYISIPSSAYGFNRWRRNINGVPLENMLTETDASWQHPFKMGAFNTPANVKYAVTSIAYELGMGQHEVAEKILVNAKNFFRLNQD